MRGQGRARKLLSEAMTIFKEAKTALDERAWNLAVRRSQEVVEFSLKALLNTMDVDYPKIHDVAPLFSRTVRERGVEIDESFLNWLLGLSSKMANKRAPAFYHDEEFSQGEAKEALGGAKKVKEFASELMTKLRRR